LIKEICGGKISSGIIDIYPDPVRPKKILLEYKKLNELTGTTISADSAKTILTALGYDILEDEQHHCLVSVPTSKTDITRPESVIEEVLRIYGFDKIPVSGVMKRSVQSTQPNQIDTLVEIFADYLSANGFSETISNSITNGKKLETVFGYEPATFIKLLVIKMQDLILCAQHLSAVDWKLFHIMPTAKMPTLSFLNSVRYFKTRRKKY